MPKIVITPETLPVALHMLDKWTGKLTWSLYAQKLAGALGVDSISRFTLSAYPEIAKAFNSKKELLRDGDKGAMGCDATLDMLLQEKAAMEAKLKRLEEKNNRFKEQFVRWQQNLYMMPGVDLEKLEMELDNPLPPLNRSSR